MIKTIFYSLITIFFFGNLELHAQQGKVDHTFNTLDDGLTGDGFDDPVRTLSLQSDQKLIVGGDYLNLNGKPAHYLTRLNPDGTVDENFNIGTGFNGKVYSSCILPNGQILIGGSFTSFNGVTVGRLIRLNSDGSYDPLFNTIIGASGIVYDICPQSDGSIIIAGSFAKYNNVTVNRIARIFLNGALDNSFTTGSASTATINTVKVLSNGKVLVGGNFEKFNGVEVNRMVRLNTNGTIDSSFNIGYGFDDDINVMKIQEDGKIILGGKFTVFNGVSANRIIRLNEDGSIDSSFSIGTGFSSGAVLTIKADSETIMVGGSFSGKYNGISVNRVCVLNQDGSLSTDIDFGSGPASASVFALEKDTEGSYYIGGSFSVFDGMNQGKLVKIDSEGEYDISYLAAGIGFDNSVYKIISLENKKSLVLGKFKKFNGSSAFGIAKLLEDGSSDLEFNPGQTGASHLMRAGILQSDGKIILGGDFTKYNEATINRVVRIFPNGQIDAAFSIGSGFNSSINAIAIQADERIIMAGKFTKFNDVAVGKIIRLLPNGSRDTSFNVGLGANESIDAVLIQPDGKILVGGHFTTFNGIPYAKIIRLNSDGSIDYTFNIGKGFDKYVYALALQSDKKIIVGGTFTSYNDITQKRILRLNTDGSFDTTFESGTGFSKGDVRTILVQPDDRILVGGAFSGTYKTDNVSRLIRLSKSGSLDNLFVAPLNKTLSTMCFTSDYKLLIGGDFNSVGGISKHRAARLKLCLESTTWNGISWSNGFPSGGKEVFFKDDYPELTTTDVCSCNIDENKKVTLLSENTLGIEFSYTGLGTLIMEDSANLYQSDDDMVNTGNIHLKRKSAPILKSDFTYWSSPVKDFKLVDLSPNSPSDRYFSYDYNLKNWINENPSNSMVLGKGYIVQGPLDFSSTIASTFETTFKGIPNNGKVEVSIGSSNTANLIGNPYPSTLNADAFLVRNTSKIRGTLYFWTHNTPIKNGRYTSDDYAAYNLLGGVGTRGALTSGSNQNTPDNTIASGQSFIVASQMEGKIEFDDSMRMKVKNSIFFKPEKNKEETIQKQIEKHRVWLNLSNSEGLFKQILVGYITGATNQYDMNFDALSFNANQYGDFYSLVDGIKLVIQGRELPFDKNDSVLLGYNSSITGTFNISIDHQDGQFLNSNVFLEDKDLNKIHNLKNDAYSFETQKGTFNDRFALKYLDNTLNTISFEDANSGVFVAVNSNTIVVNATNTNINKIVVFDISGKQLFEKDKIALSKYSFPNLYGNNQLLILKIKLENGNVLSRKILL